MGNQVNLGLTIFGDTSQRKGVVRPQLTLDRVIRWIKSQELDEYTTQGLIELASKYPTHALPMFRRNFAVMLSRVRAKKAKEEGPIVQSRKETNEEDWQKTSQNQIVNQGPGKEDRDVEKARSADSDQSPGSGKATNADLESRIASLSAYQRRVPEVSPHSGQDRQRPDHNIREDDTDPASGVDADSDWSDGGNS